MTFAYKNIKAFIQLLENSPELFNAQDRQTLADKIPEDIESISESLLAWCEQRPEINDALRQVRRTLPDDEPQSKGPGGTFPDAPTRAEYEKNLRETLINALRQSSPPENPKPKTPKG
jgi:hypothetical protein